MQLRKDTGNSTGEKTDLAVVSGPLLTQCEDAAKDQMKLLKQQRLP